MKYIFIAACSTIVETKAKKVSTWNRRSGNGQMQSRKKDLIGRIFFTASLDGVTGDLNFERSCARQSSPFAPEGLSNKIETEFFIGKKGKESMCERKLEAGRIGFTASAIRIMLSS